MVAEVFHHVDLRVVDVSCQVCSMVSVFLALCHSADLFVHWRMAGDMEEAAAPHTPAAAQPPDTLHALVSRLVLALLFRDATCNLYCHPAIKS